MKLSYDKNGPCLLKTPVKVTDLQESIMAESRQKSEDMLACQRTFSLSSWTLQLTYVAAFSSGTESGFYHFFQNLKCICRLM